jgi:hypothetical protein
MGANSVTTVPVYVSGEVLTAADLNITNSGIPVFEDSSARDAAFGGTGEKVLAEGQFAFLEDTNVTQFYDGSSWEAVGVSGLVLVATATPTAVASVSINNCFTSTYENYRIVGNMTNASGTGQITARLRAAETDTTTNYSTQLTEFYQTSLATTLDPVGTDEWYISDINATQVVSSFAFDIFSPQTAQKTKCSGQNMTISVAGILVSQTNTSVQSGITQFDGITFLSSVDITGSIRIYGYANS